LAAQLAFQDLKQIDKAQKQINICMLVSALQNLCMSTAYLIVGSISHDVCAEVLAQA